jgi:hypothetical protein
VSFRKSCRLTNRIVTNPKDVVSDDKIVEWREKMKTLIGINLLGHITQNSKDMLIMRSYISKSIRFFVDEKSEFCMIFNHGMIDFARKYIFNFGPKYSIIEDNTILTNDGMYSVYKFENYRNVFEHSEEIGKFIYQIYITFICEEQKKNSKLVMNCELSKFLKVLLDDSLLFEDHVSNFLEKSRYLYLVHEETKDFPLPNSSIVRRKETMMSDLYGELTKYFMDGEEAEKFMSWRV